VVDDAHTHNKIQRKMPSPMHSNCEIECIGEGGFLGVLCVLWVHVGRNLVCASSAVRCLTLRGVVRSVFVKAHSPLLPMLLGRRVLLVKWEEWGKADCYRAVWWPRASSFLCTAPSAVVETLL
jgi:hypothetical protein